MKRNFQAAVAERSAFEVLSIPPPGPLFGPAIEADAPAAPVIKLLGSPESMAFGAEAADIRINIAPASGKGLNVIGNS